MVFLAGAHPHLGARQLRADLPDSTRSIPFAGSYRPFWLGLGAVSFDLMLAVTITSLLRQRMGYAQLARVHWLTYASWPIALLHGFGTGSDVKATWLLALSIACLLVVARGRARARARRLAGEPARPRRGARRRGRVLAVPRAVAPSGPLGSEWARRSGTPSALLPPLPRLQLRAGAGDEPARPPPPRPRSSAADRPAGRRRPRCHACWRESTSRGR